MLTSEAFKDRQMVEVRLFGLRLVLVACFLALTVAFWLLQVVQHAKYDEMAANNHLRTIPLRAPRGVLLDRNGQVLVENRYSFTIAIVRERTAHLDETMRRIAALTAVPEARIREAVQSRIREPRFRPLPVLEHATFAQVAAVSARRLELPEVVVQRVPTRQYPSDRLAAHLFGYVGEIQESQLLLPDFANLQSGAIVGQAGLERVYNPQLMGTDGNRFVVVNSRGREISELDKEDPVDGRRMQLTIDLDLQRALEDGFQASGFTGGAAAILDPRTGEILAMTSRPAYDPNAFASGLGGAAWAQLTSDPHRPMTNRLIQGTYFPGSTFKIAMSVAALETGAIPPDFSVYCPGHYEFGGRSFSCSLPNGRGHGLVNLSHAIEKSCNVFFYTVGSRMKIDTIHEYAAKLGLVGKTGIDLPGEQDSFVASTAWSERVRKQPWYPGETISVSIGQGAVSVTPIGLATMISTIANGGTLITPHLVKQVEGENGWSAVPTPAPKSSLAIKPENLQLIRNGLWMVVNEAGTGRGARIEGRDVSGKTGTAQVVSNQGKSAAAGAGMDTRDNAWFVFFAPRDNPQIAGAIFVEHGGHGGTSATPIAKRVMETFFAKLDGLPLPTQPAAAVGPPVARAAAPAGPPPAAPPEAPQ